MYKKTSIIHGSVSYKGRHIGARVIYAKIVSSPRGTPYDRMYGKFEGFYVKFKGRFRKLYEKYSGAPYIK
jgi:hypothetical protein